jgi:uncharacterized protein YjiS (DUF1127 family)
MESEALMEMFKAVKEDIKLLREEVREVRQKSDRIDHKVSDIGVRYEAIEDIREEVSKLRHSVFGNGSEGLEEKVRSLKNLKKWVITIGLFLVIVFAAAGGAERLLDVLKVIV